VLPGNAAYAVLGHTASPQRLHTLEVQLHLNQSAPEQYWAWFRGIVAGNFGRSLANGQSVSELVVPRLENSAILILAAGLIGTVLAMTLGVIAALRRGRVTDELLSTTSLAVTALPEFVIGITLVILFASVVTHLLPAVALIPPGASAWSQPRLLILPVATLVIVIVPYIFRMMRATMIEALASDYVEMAELNGVPTWRIVLFHALPNAIPPTIQVIGLTFLYLAGGIVLVESVFSFPGIGTGLVNAVADRDIPVIQFIVLILAAFYVAVNMISDAAALLATPRRRLPR
jgi:peptide/nickel transport system permease protein